MNMIRERRRSRKYLRKLIRRFFFLRKNKNNKYSFGKITKTITENFFVLTNIFLISRNSEIFRIVLKEREVNK